MEMGNNGYRLKRGTIRARDLLIWCFSFWPLFWNLWVSIRITTVINYYIPNIVLVCLSLAALLPLKKKYRKSFLYSWFIFIAVIIVSGVRGIQINAIPDILVIVCAVLFCIGMEDSAIDTTVIIRCLSGCGLFVALTVIIDSVTGIFQTGLLWIYTDYGREIVLRRMNTTATGGIIPHTGSAGCFLFAGLGAYIVSFHGKKTSFRNWFVIALFAIAILIIRKRGFLLDIAITAFVLWICGWRFEAVYRVNLKRQIRFAILLIALEIMALALYNSVPLVRSSFDSLLNKFTSDDTTLNGRTLLYALAYSLFQTNPVWGIGWGRYRGQTLGLFSSDSSTTFEAHNVYLQLLCETGIIGFAMFLIVTVASLVHAIKKYRLSIKAGVKNNRYYALRLGIYLQLFFLAYCFSGNPLYDYNFLIVYFVGILITLQ